MTKEELEKEKQELVDRYQELGDKYSEFYIKKGFDSAVALLLPKLEEAIRFLTIIDNELNVSATGLSIYKNEGTHREIKAAIRELKGEKND